MEYKEKLKKKEELGDGVLDLEEHESEGFPHECGKCGHTEADVVDLGQQYSDEASIYLFKCKKCGNVKRDAYGSGN